MLSEVRNTRSSPSKIGDDYAGPERSVEAVSSRSFAKQLLG